MKYTEVVYSIRERIRQLADDSDVDNREIIFHVNQQRALFYRNQYNQRNRTVDEEIKQLLRFEMAQDSIEECGESKNCYIIKSVKPLPATIELHHRNAIFKITSTSKTAVPFSIVSWNEFPYQGLGKYSQNELFATVGPDNHIYIKSSNKLIKFVESILVTAILENPLDIENYTPCPNGETCFDLDSFEYPIKGYAYAYIQDKVVNIFVNKLQVPQDEENDSED